MGYIHAEHETAVQAELARLQELSAELGLPIELVCANELQLRRRSLMHTRGALADALAAAQPAAQL